MRACSRLTALAGKTTRHFSGLRPIITGSLPSGCFSPDAEPSGVLVKIKLGITHRRALGEDRDSKGKWIVPCNSRQFNNGELRARPGTHLAGMLLFVAEN